MDSCTKVNGWRMDDVPGDVLQRRRMWERVRSDHQDNGIEGRIFFLLWFFCVLKFGGLELANHGDGGGGGRQYTLLYSHI